MLAIPHSTENTGHDLHSTVGNSDDLVVSLFLSVSLIGMLRNFLKDVPWIDSFWYVSYGMEIAELIETCRLLQSM